MGKGDRKSKRGKIWRGSFGNSRRHKLITKVVTKSNPAKAAKSKED